MIDKLIDIIGREAVLFESFLELLEKLGLKSFIRVGILDKIVH